MSWKHFIYRRSYQPLGTGANTRAHGRRRMVAIMLIVLIGTLILLMSRGRGEDTDERHLDPAFDPLNNPNIHVQESI